jgi:hypothetical protein
MLGEAALGVLLLWAGVKVGAVTYAWVRYGNCGDKDDAAKPGEDVEPSSVGGEAMSSAGDEAEGLRRRPNATKQGSAEEGDDA